VGCWRTRHARTAGRSPSTPATPALTGCSWDALSDSLWEGLYSLEAKQIVIVWPDSSVMSKAVPSDFETALSVLADVAESLSNPDFTNGNPKNVCIYVGRRE
jgi:hypothetical protein